MSEACVFVPGLFTTELWLDGERVWPFSPSALYLISKYKAFGKGEEDYLELVGLLACDERGCSKNKVVPGRVISSGFDLFNGSSFLKNVFPAFLDVYNVFFNSLEKRGVSVYPFGYDWRLSVESHYDRLRELVSRVFELHDKVVLVGHSMGGLVVRSFLSEWKGCDDFEKVFLVSSVNNGTPLAYYVLRTGKGGLYTSFFDDFVGLTVNFESVYQLLPNIVYFNLDKDWLGFKVNKRSGGFLEELVCESVMSSPEKVYIDSPVFGLSNELLVKRSLAFHNGLLSFSDDCYKKVVNVVPTGFNTVNKVVYESVFPNKWSGKFSVVRSGDGDGTVTSVGCSLRDAMRVSENVSSVVEKRHNALMGDDSVVSLVLNCLSDS